MKWHEAFLIPYQAFFMKHFNHGLHISNKIFNHLLGFVPREPEYNSDEINIEITYDEVAEAINNSNVRKAYLEIPNEVMKNKNAKLLLCRFFNLCFISGLNPTDWDFSDIIPIPKKDKDARDPLQNRCITIVCSVAKIYSGMALGQVVHA